MIELNGTIIQYFHWYIPSDSDLWLEAAEHARELATAGFTAVWLPSAYKTINKSHDLHPATDNAYNLGPIRQQEEEGRTRYGTHQQYLEAIDALQKNQLQVNGHLSIFDMPLHYNFHRASRADSHFEMWHLLDNSLSQARPTETVTFVENHDSQPLQPHESVVEPWFKPLAYATILLRQEGYPCVFYADYYGAEYEECGLDGQLHKIIMPSHRWLIDKFLHARQHHAYGEQYDYFDHPNTVGWTRLGDTAHLKAMAVLMTNGTDGHKWMEVGRPNAKFIDLTEHIDYPVYTNEWGWGEFKCPSRSVSVWIEM